MKNLVYAVLILSGAAFFSSAGATSYFPEERYFPVGSNVILFQSGTEEIKTRISVHDTLSVYRAEGRNSLKEVGTVEVVSKNGKYFMSGKIITGEINSGDVAVKEGIGCIIIGAGGSNTK